MQLICCIRNILSIFVAICKSKKNFLLVNSFQVNGPFLFPLKISENIWFSKVFRMGKNGKLAWNELSSNDFESDLIFIYNDCTKVSAI